MKDEHLSIRIDQLKESFVHILADLVTKISSLEIENDSLQNEINHLTEENEKLSEQLSEVLNIKK